MVVYSFAADEIHMLTVESKLSPFCKFPGEAACGFDIRTTLLSLACGAETLNSVRSRVFIWEYEMMNGNI